MQRDAQITVKRIERVAQQGCSVREVEIACVPGSLMELNHGFPDPPQIPDILQPIPAVRKEVSGKLRHGGISEQAEGAKVEHAGRENHFRQLVNRMAFHASSDPVERFESGFPV